MNQIKNLFSPNDIGKLKGYLYETIKNENSELEIRFSTKVDMKLFPNKKEPVTSGQQPENYRFLPYIDKKIFYRTLNHFKNIMPDYTTNFTIDTFYDKFIRKTEEEGKPDVWMNKINQKKIDIWNMNIRISLSQEEILQSQQNPNQRIFTMQRQKNRTSFLNYHLRFDFTEITTKWSNGNQKESFEIEMEYVAAKNPIDVPSISEHIIFWTHQMLSFLQESFIPMSLTEKHNVLLEYVYITKSEFNGKFCFAGAQPETLHIRHLPKIKSSSYSISEKYDGERFLLFFSDKNNGVYLIDRLLRLKLTDIYCPQANLRGTILDIEMVCNDAYVFDIIFYKGTDLRGNVSFNLKKRLEIIDNIVPIIQKESYNSLVKIFLKKHYFDFNILTQLKDEPEEGVVIPKDGYIFTPIDEFYPKQSKWSNLLKWKPSYMNSIDFLLLKTSDGLYYTLNVGDRESKAVIFEQSPRIKIEDSVSKDLDGMIVECIYNEKKETFEPFRVRDDKYKPNFQTVAMDIWESIKHPVDIYKDLHLQPFQNMREYHNRIKIQLISKATKLADFSEYINVIDLACGRGGDLLKWNSIAQVAKRVIYMGVDVSEEYLNEAIERMKKLENRDIQRKLVGFKLECTFYKCDLSEEIIELPYKASIVSCQFALHYFYKSKDTFETFIQNILNHILPGGIFIATLFDGSLVYNAITLGKNKMKENDLGYTITPTNTLYDIKTLKDKEFSIPINVNITGDSSVILKNPTTEYLVFPDKFVYRMSTYGFILIETYLFDDKKIEDKNISLNNVESNFSKLHRAYIFKYIENTEEGKKTYCNTYLEDLYPSNTSLFLLKLTEIENLSYMLHMFTGRSIPFTQDKTELSEHFNVFIGEISIDDVITFYSPKIQLEELKMIWIKHDESADYVIGYHDQDNISRFLFDKAHTLEITNIDENNLESVKEDEILDLSKMTIKDILLFAEGKNIKIPTIHKKRKNDMILFITDKLKS